MDHETSRRAPNKVGGLFGSVSSFSTPSSAGLRQQFPAIENETICIFGASSTWGAWDYERSGWSSRLRLFLDSEKKDRITYNLGISGDTTDRLLKRFDVESEARKPTVIIVSIGDNDSIHIKSKNEQMVPLERFERNLQALANKAKKYTSKIVFLGCKKVDESKTTPIPWTPDYHYTNQTLKSYDRKIKEVAEKNKIHYLHLFDLLKNDDLEDGLHPNSKGHQKIFLRVRDLLLERKLL